MSNVNVFRGSDASIVLAVDDSASVEVKLADGLMSQDQLFSIVKRLPNVPLQVENELKPDFSLFSIIGCPLKNLSLLEPCILVLRR